MHFRPLTTGYPVLVIQFYAKFKLNGNSKVSGITKLTLSVFCLPISLQLRFPPVSLSVCQQDNSRPKLLMTVMEIFILPATRTDIWKFANQSICGVNEIHRKSHMSLKAIYDLSIFWRTLWIVAILMPTLTQLVASEHNWALSASSKFCKELMISLTEQSLPPTYPCYFPKFPWEK